jgi:hypothetical protein
MVQLSKAGLLSRKPWQEIDAVEMDRLLDPALRGAGGKKNGNGNPDRKGKGKVDPPPTPTPEEMSRLQGLLEEMNIPDIELSEVDRQDLEHIDKLTQTQLQMERLKDIEAEIVETEKWNHDAARDLLDLVLKEKRIPLQTRSELFDLRPTAMEVTSSKLEGTLGSSRTELITSGTSGGDNERAIADGEGSTSKGKERAAEVTKRSIYHLLPEDAKGTWLPTSGKS